MSGAARRKSARKAPDPPAAADAPRRKLCNAATKGRRTVLREAIPGVTAPAIRRLARRAGVVRAAGLDYARRMPATLSAPRSRTPTPPPVVEKSDYEKERDARIREGKGGFNVTSTCEFSDEMCQRKCPLFENSTRDDLSSKNESKRVKTDRDTSLER